MAWQWSEVRRVQTQSPVRQVWLCARMRAVRSSRACDRTESRTEPGRAGRDPRRRAAGGGKNQTDNGQTFYYVSKKPKRTRPADNGPVLRATRAHATWRPAAATDGSHIARARNPRRADDPRSRRFLDVRA